MRKRLKADPATKDYKDVSITPPEKGVEALDMFNVTVAARGAVEKAKKRSETIARAHARAGTAG